MRPDDAVTVVVPVWNQRELLARLLETLRSQTVQPELVIAIDNGSTDGAAELAEAQGTHVIRMGRNTGFAAAVNRGIAEAKTAWVALVNSDVALEPEWLGRLLTGAREADAAFATGKILSSREPAIVDGLFDLVARSGCAWRVGSGWPDRAFHLPFQKIALASGTAVLFQKAVFDRIGGFDERFESYLEDVDLGLRCAAAGLSGVYVPEAVCFHRGSASSGRWSRAVVRRISRNQVWLVAKHYGPGTLRRYWWQIVAGQALWGLVALRHGRWGAWLTGKWGGIRGWRRMRAETRGIDEVLGRGEREILVHQRAGGPDAYWKWYSRLAGGAE